LTDPVIAWMTYKEIVSTYAGAEWVDHWHLPNGYIMYYNGIPTIKNKTQLAMKNAAGIMIWELMYDVADRKSLLNAIYEAASATR
jgi:chitinase